VQAASRRLAVKAAVKRGPSSLLGWPSASSFAAFTPQSYGFILNIGEISTKIFKKSP